MLPLVGPRGLLGQSLNQAAETIRRAYTVENKVLVPGRDRIVLSLLKSRVHRVLVIRDDVNADRGPSYYSRRRPPYTKRGKGVAVDLPTGENDVLHALIDSGGLPGIDAYNDVWVLRGRASLGADQAADDVQRVSGGDLPIRELAENGQRLRSFIPLRVPRGAPIPFGPDDIVLDDGDIVFLKSRDDEVFFTGGLLPGGVFPLPRDHDLNVLEAIGLATASAGGPAGQSGAILNFRGGAQGGIINPTRVLVVRQLASGEQIKISIDLSAATAHSRANLIVRPNDFIMLQFTASEYAGNFVLSLFRTGIVASNASLQNNAASTSNTVGTGGQPGGGEVGNNNNP